MPQLQTIEYTLAAKQITARIAASLPACTKVKAAGLDTDGTLLVAAAGAGDLAIGTVQEDYTYVAGRGNTVTVFVGGRQRLVASGAITALDLLKTAASGKAQPDGTTGSTALSVNTDGQALEAAANGAYFEAVLFARL
jgi:hypothetical protein